VNQQAGGEHGDQRPQQAMRLELLDDQQLGELRDAVLARLAVQGEINWVEYSLGSAPTGWVLAGRAAPDALFGGGHTALAGGGLATAVRDAAGAEPRCITEADIDAFCRVADALPQVAVVEPPCVPGDDAAAARLGAVARAFAASGKHVMAVCGSLQETSAVIQMATAVAGGPDELRRRPLATIALMPGVGVSAAGAAAVAGLPCLIAMAPSFFGAEDRAAALTESLAAALGVAAALQFSHPGARVGLALPPGRRGPLDAAALADTAAAAQLTGSFGLPFVATALATQAAAPDWLASAENTYAALVCHTAGAAGIAGAGLLDGGASVSLHELVLDAEIFSYCAATAAGVPVDEETVALETIEHVGIAGNALGERHTRQHMRDVWRPRLFDRTPYGAWEREGRRQSYELADDLARSILESSAADPLPADTAAELSKIAASAGRSSRDA
jgi:trimethylamine--corrinoid protein Co-methyltransferase